MQFGVGVHDLGGGASLVPAAPVGAVVVVVAEVVIEVAAWPGDGGGDVTMEGGLVALLEDDPLDSFYLAVGLGTAGVDEAVGRSQFGQGLSELGGAVFVAVEFLIVVKDFLRAHVGVGTSGVSERSATPFLTRSSRRVALWVLEMERRASRISAGIW